MFYAMCRWLVCFLLCVWVGSHALYATTQSELYPALQETSEILFASERAQPLKAKASELHTPLAIYQYVRNLYDFYPYSGSRSNSINTFFSGGANNIDLSALLIAMLRSQNIPARYVTGEVIIPVDEVGQWLGLDNPNDAVSMLATLDHDVYISFDALFLSHHVWVEAFVPKSAVTGEHELIDCYSTPEHCQWVELDPSFKFKTPSPHSLDLLDTLTFDYEAYYRAYQNQDTSRMHKNPLQVYEDQIQTYLSEQQNNLALKDLHPETPVQAEGLNQLPTSLPYRLKTYSRRYISLEEHDDEARQTNRLNEIWARFLEVTITKATPSGEADPSVTIFEKQALMLSDLSLDAVRLEFETCGPGCVESQLRVGERIAATQTLANGELQWGDRVHIAMEESIERTTESGKRFANTHVGVVGGQYVLGVGDLNSNWQQVKWSVDQLFETQQALHIQADGNGNLFVDSNDNGTRETDEAWLQDAPETNKQLLARFLEVGNRLYFYQMWEARQRIGDYHQIPPSYLALAVLGTVHEVQYLDGVVQAFQPEGMVISVQILTSSLWHRKKDLSLAHRDKNMELLGIIGSVYEHQLWEQLTSYAGISAVGGIQQALDQGAELLEVNTAQSPSSLDNFYTKTGFSASPPAGWNPAVWELFNTRPMSWEPSDTSNEETGLTVLQTVVDGNTSEARRGLHASSAQQHAWYRSISQISQSLQSRIQQEGGSCQVTSPGIQFGGQTYTGACVEVLQALETAYLQQTETPSHAFFDQNPNELNGQEGFQPDIHQYRETSQPQEAHNAQLVQLVRDRSLLENKKFILASQRTLGSQGATTVYIERPGSYIVSNDHFHADGGFVSAGPQAAQRPPFLPPTGTNLPENHWDVSIQNSFFPTIKFQDGWNRIPTKYLASPFSPEALLPLRNKQEVQSYVVMQNQEGQWKGWEMGGGIANVNAYNQMNMPELRQIDVNQPLWIALWASDTVELPVSAVGGIITDSPFQRVSSPGNLAVEDYWVTPSTYWPQRKQSYRLRPGWNAIELFSDTQPWELLIYSYFLVAGTERSNYQSAREALVFWQNPSDQWASWTDFGPVEGSPNLETFHTEKTLWVYNNLNLYVMIVETLPVMPQIRGIDVTFSMLERDKRTEYTIRPPQDPSHTMSTLYVHSHESYLARYRHFGFVASSPKWHKGCGWRDGVVIGEENHVSFFMVREGKNPNYDDVYFNKPRVYNIEAFCGDSTWGYRIVVFKAEMQSHGKIIEANSFYNLRNEQGLSDLSVRLEPQPIQGNVEWTFRLSTEEEDNAIFLRTELPADQYWHLKAALQDLNLEGTVQISWSLHAPDAERLPEGSREQIRYKWRSSSFLVTEGDPVELVKTQVTEELQQVLQTTKVENQLLGEELWVQSGHTFQFSFDNLPDLGGTYEILWDFGDGQFSNSNQVSHQYDAPGTYEVTVRITCTGCSQPLGRGNNYVEATTNFKVQVSEIAPGPNGESIFVLPPPSDGNSNNATSGVAKVPLGIQDGTSNDGLSGWKGTSVNATEDSKLVSVEVERYGGTKVIEQTICVPKQATLLEFTYYSTYRVCLASSCRTTFKVKISAPRTALATYTLFDSTDIISFPYTPAKASLPISQFAGLCGVNIQFEYRLQGQDHSDLFLSHIQTNSTNDAKLNIPIDSVTSRDRLVQASFEVPSSLDLNAFSFQFQKSDQSFGPYYLNDLVIQEGPDAFFQNGTNISPQARNQEVFVVRDANNSRKFHVYALFDTYGPILFQLKVGSNELASLPLTLSPSEGFRGCLGFADQFIHDGTLSTSRIVPRPDDPPSGFKERGLVLPVVAPLLIRDCNTEEWQIAEGFLKGFADGVADDAEAVQEVLSAFADPIKRASELYQTFQLLLDADVEALINKALKDILIAKDQAIQWVANAPDLEKAYVKGYVLGYVSEQVLSTVITAPIGGVVVRGAINAVKGSQIVLSSLSKAKAFTLRVFGFVSMGLGKAELTSLKDMLSNLKKKPVNPDCDLFRVSALDLPCDRKVAEFLEERYGDDDWQERMQLIESLTGKKSGPEVEGMLNKLAELTARLGSGTADRLPEGAIEGFFRIAKHLDDGNFSTQKLVNDFGDSPSLSEGLEKLRTIDLDIIDQVKQARNLNIYDDLSLVSKLGEYLQLIKNEFKSDVINDESPFRLIKGYKRDEISVDVNLSGDAISGLAVMKEGDNSFGRKHVFDFIRQNDTITRAQQIINAELVGVSSNQDVFRIIKETLETGQVITQNKLIKNFPNQKGETKTIEVVLGDRAGSKGSIVTVKIQ